MSSFVEYRRVRP